MNRMARSSAAMFTAALSAIVVGSPSEAAPGRPDVPFAVTRAAAALAARPADFVAGDADRFILGNATVDADGTSHVRYDRTYRGLPVLGGDGVVHLDRAGRTRSITQDLAAPLALSSTPRVTAAEAGQVAAAAFDRAGAPTAPTLAVDAAGPPALAWQTFVPGVADTDGERSTMTVLVDANTGAVRGAWPDRRTGTGDGFHNGTVALTTTRSGDTYELKDPTRGGIFTTDMNNTTLPGPGTTFTDPDDVWGDGTLAHRQTVAVDAQYGLAETWDYFLNVHGRSGIAGDGRGSYNRVHYSRGYANASWDDGCFCMTYGDGAAGWSPFVSLDIVGHEMTHGVTSSTAGLRYSGESGGLNEATSDIFGTLVEFYAGNPRDVPDYLIGEKVGGAGQPLRYLDDPKKDGKSVSCWTSDAGTLDVHYSSGVANHFFFMLAVGSGTHTVNGVAYDSPTCGEAPAVTGIGNDAAGRIYYRALTTYMTSTTDFHGARAATLAAAADLYGPAGAEYESVAAAWTAAAVY